MVVKTATFEFARLLDLDDPEKAFEGLIRFLVEQYVETVGERLEYLIKDNIENEVFLSRTGIAVEGIIDFGEYRRSWELSDLFASDRIIQANVKSSDPKGKQIEEGMTPAQVQALGPELEKNIIAWVARKGITYRRGKGKAVKGKKLRLAKRIYLSMRNHGIQPKPIVERSIERLKADAPYILEQTVSKVNSRANFAIQLRFS